MAEMSSSVDTAHQGQIVTLSVHRFLGIAAKVWVLGQMGAARLSFMAMKDVSFWKLCGSGVGEGFTPRPNTEVWAILAVWPDEATARDRISNAPVYQRWARNASEVWTVFLSPTSARGRWSSKTPFIVTDKTNDGPVAALTRATVRPSAMARFWKRQPAISDVIGDDPNVIFKIGIGEVPLLQQVTFSIWPDTSSMAAFARADGPHAKAIKAVREGNWFREELYARFRIIGETGLWNGRPVLAQAERTAA